MTRGYLSISISAALLLALSACDSGGGETCTPKASTRCESGITFWLDSCGALGEVAETCGCGCAADGLTCDDVCCEPQCEGRQCGDDGCGGLCGPGCPADETCEDGICSGCEPSCGDRVCGDDGCGALCGTCPDGEACREGACVACDPQCEGRECGDDGCDGVCGTCRADETCEDGLCVACEPQCEGRECGDDGCGGLCPPGCEAGEACEDGQCVGCERQCEDRECGDDGCGGLCGPGCDAGERCENGTCVGCAPQCDGRECGDDGCGGECGPGCADDETCEAGLCVRCEPDCDGRECGDDGCGGLCGPGCAEDELCGAGGVCVCQASCEGRQCGDDGCGGQCGPGCSDGYYCTEAGQCAEEACGARPPVIEGRFETDVAPVTFDGALVALEHKRDVDAEEGGCVTRVELELTSGEGCVLQVVAAEKYTVNEGEVGGLEVQYVEFRADSFCPSFPDATEGVYAGTGELTVAEVRLLEDQVPGYDAAESCLQTTMTLRLRGELLRVDDAEPLRIPQTDITLTGRFLSTGDTAVSCPCRPACDGRNCGDDGCDGVCGTCADAERCGAEGLCLAIGAGECFEDGTVRAKRMPALGDVVISEIMANPDAVSDADGEWFEVWLANPIDINGLSVGRDAESMGVVVPNGDCAPVDGGYLLFARDADPEVNGGLPAVDYTFGFSLTNSDAGLAVGYDGAILDLVTYESSQAGVSLSLDKASFDPQQNDSSYFWCAGEEWFAAQSYGTPGSENANCPGVSVPDCMDVANGGVERPIVPPEPGDIFITEFMANPAAVGDSAGEWFELYVGADVDLNGLQVGRFADTLHDLSDSTDCLRFNTGDHVLVARSDSNAANGGLPAVDFTFSFNLVNSDGAILVWHGGRELDAVTYSSSGSGSSTALDPEHYSADGNDDSANWCRGTSAWGIGTDDGTPGAPNAACQ